MGLVYGEEVAEAAEGLDQGVNALGGVAGTVDATLGIARLLGDDDGVNSDQAGELLALLQELVGKAMVGGSDLEGYLGLLHQAEDAFLALVDGHCVLQLLDGSLLLLANTELGEALLRAAAVHVQEVVDGVVQWVSHLHRLD